MKKYFYLILFLSLFPISVKAINLNTIVDTPNNQLTHSKILPFSNGDKRGIKEGNSSKIGEKVLLSKGYLGGSKNPQSSPEIAQLNQNEITEMLKAVTVKVSANNNRGTGTIIGKEGNKYLIITNFHVIRGSNTITIETSDGKTHQAQLIKNGINSDYQYDLALLEFSSENQYQKVRISIQPPELETPIIAGGYADESRQLKVTRGEIKQIADKPLKDGYEIGYSGEIVQGMSGGGIFFLYEDLDLPEDSELFLIGINGRSSYPIINTGYIYQDGDKPSTAEVAKMREVNWGIAINTLLAIVEQEILITYGLPLPVDNSRFPIIKSTRLLELLTISPKWLAKIEAEAKQFTVRIESSSGENGSGVIIFEKDNVYTVLTADHVLCEKGKYATVNDPCLDYQYTIITHDGESHPLKKNSIIRQEGVDLAIFKFRSEENYSIAELAEYHHNTNDFVFTAGFPKINSTNAQWLFSGGTIYDQDRRVVNTRIPLNNIIDENGYSQIQVSGDSINTTTFTQGYELVYTNITHGGMSGGAVLDINGKLVGIHGLSEAIDGRLQLGYSLGIPITTFMALQNKFKIQLKQPTKEKPQITEKKKQQIQRFILYKNIPSNTNAQGEVWIERANLLLRKKQYLSAISFFEKTIKQNNPDNVYLAWYGVGLALLETAKFEVAIQAFQRAIINLPEDKLSQHLHGDILYRQVLAYQSLRDYDKGIALINKAIEISPNDPKYYHEKSLLLYLLQDYINALTAIDQSLNLSIRPLWYFQKANIYIAQKKWQLAEAELKKAIELNPNYARAYWREGLIYAEQNKWQLAESSYTKAINSNPNYTRAYYDRGNLYSQQKKWRLAESDYTKAIELDANDIYHWIPPAYPFFVRGTLYLEQEKWDLALADYTKAIELELKSDDFAFPYHNRGIIYEKQEKWDLALADYTRAIEIRPNFVKSHIHRGNVYYQQKKYDLALADYSKAIELDSNHAVAYFNRGNLYRIQKKYDLALSDLDKAIELDSNHGESYYARARIYYNQEKWDLALTDYTRAIEINPSYIGTYLYRGYIYYKQKKWDLALTDFTQVIKSNPNDEDAHFYRGSIYYHQEEEWDLALADFNKAIEINPHDGLYYSYIGLIYHHKKQWQLALINYQKAMTLNNDNVDILAGIKNNIGLIKYEQLENKTEAIKYWQQVLEIKPQYPDSILAMAVYYHNLGEQEKGLNLAKQAFDIDKKFSKIEVLKKNLWGEKLIADTQKLLANPQVQNYINQ